MKTGNATLPLHGGNCPAWLFVHMKALSAAIIEVIIEDFGVDEVLSRLSNPYWFQALGCVVGFDWHSSGVTTTVCGAIKEGLAEVGPRAGLFMAGGKGRTSRKTPLEIQQTADRYAITDPERLIYSSKMAAKVDNTAVQDGYQLYHHFFVFTGDGKWAVIQQGMNTGDLLARRYHWLSTAMQDFTQEPQAAICCNVAAPTLNMVSQANGVIRECATEIAKESPDRVLQELSLIQRTMPELTLPSRHSIPRTNYLNRSLYAAYERQPQCFEELLGTAGVGPGTLRALCLVAEVAYGTKPSFEDPVRYSFAHGGKDGFPFPVNETDIATSYQTLRQALDRARVGKSDKLNALRKLSEWHSQSVIADTGLTAAGFDQKKTAQKPQGTPQKLSHPSKQPLLIQPGLF